MKKIKLTQGKVALVDDEDYDFLMQWKWRVLKGSRTYYAVRSEYIGKKETSVLMHRQILGLTKVSFREIQTDHQDWNGLNNQRYNLRKCTPNENMRHKRKMNKAASSKYIGVSLNKNRRPSGKIDVKWVAGIAINGKRKTLARFDSEDDAARCYDKAAKRYYGEFASLNFPQ